MRVLLPTCVLAFLVVIVAGGRTSAAEVEGIESKLVVGVKQAAPFVMIDEESGDVSGFSIDLIRGIAAQLNPPRTVEFQVHRNIAEHLEAVGENEVDLGIAATSFTSERERTLEFSIPFYQGGLAVAVRPDRGVRHRDVLLSSKLLYALLWMSIFLAVCAHVIWLTERGRSNMFDDRWHVGVGQGIWWTIVTMTTVGYGDFVPRRPLSRILGVLIIIVGIILFGIAVGAFSSALTIEKLRSDILGPDDLDGRHIGKPVAVVRGTKAEETVLERDVEILPMESLNDALTAVETGEAVAAVHDVALLRHHLPRDAPGLVLVGRTFAEHGYGITFPKGSDLRKEINVALLELMEEGDPSLYQQLLDRWFRPGAG